MGSGTTLGLADSHGAMGDHSQASKQVRALEMKLKRRQLASKDMAIETAQALVTAVGHTKGNNPRHLISEVQDIGRRLEEAAGDGELIVGNICRRVLFMIRDEYATLVTGKNSGGRPGAPRCGPHLDRRRSTKLQVCRGGKHQRAGQGN